MKRILLMAVMLCSTLMLCSCEKSDSPRVTPNSNVTVNDFGQLEDGTAIQEYVLENEEGMSVGIMTRGATVTSLNVPDKDGNLVDVSLGFDSVEGYLNKDCPYFGAVVGRYGNRIAKGAFTLDGVTYDKLAINNGENHLHGGLVGFDKVVWDAEIVAEGDEPAVKFSYLSKDGEEGYPGNLSVSVVYTLTKDNGLKLVYDASTDKATPCNPTNHTYFNLDGEGSPTILNQVIMINADKFTPVDEGLIPLGEHADVKGTAFDFTTPKAIGQDINADEDQITFGGGYDHNFVLNSQDGSLAKAVEVYSPVTGIMMEVFTTEPGVQFYAGNFLEGNLTGRSGKIYPYRSGFCLETQHYPDTPNQPNFPTTTLKPGDKYSHETIYKFGVKN